MSEAKGYVGGPADFRVRIAQRSAIAFRGLEMRTWPGETRAPIPFHLLPDDPSSRAASSVALFAREDFRQLFQAGADGGTWAERRFPRGVDTVHEARIVTTAGSDMPALVAAVRSA